MKITAVKTVVVAAPPNRNWVFVKVETDQAGLYGWGEGTLEWKTRAVVGADVVWLQAARFDRGTRVVDAASLRLASGAVYGEAQFETVGIVDRILNQRISSRLRTFLWLRA